MKARTYLLVASLAIALTGAWVLTLRDRNGEPATATEALPGSVETPDDGPAPLAAESAPGPAADRSLDAEALTPISAARAGADCAPAPSPLSASIEDEAAAIDRAGVRELLRASQDAEHLAAAALLADGPLDRVADITKAMTTGRNNAAIVWTAVQICDRGGADAGCPVQEWEDQLLRLDGGNSEAWMHAAVGRWRRGDNAAALEAVQRAAASGETRTYWADSVEMLERALASTGRYGFSTRAVAAFGIAAANLPDYTGHAKMCREQATESPAWADACLAYGQLVERRDRTEIGQSIATAIQISALQANGQNAGEVAARMSRAKARRSSYELAARNDALVISTPAQFSTYLATLREQGEVAALQSLLPSARACEK